MTSLTDHPIGLLLAAVLGSALYATFRKPPAQVAGA